MKQFDVNDINEYKYDVTNVNFDRVHDISIRNIQRLQRLPIKFVFHFNMNEYIEERIRLSGNYIIFSSSYNIPLVGGPMGPKSVTVVDGLLAKYFSSLAIMCLPYVYLRSDWKCGRILFISTLRWLDSHTSNIFCTT